MHIVIRYAFFVLIILFFNFIASQCYIKMQYFAFMIGHL